MSGFDYWKQAHDALVVYHQGRANGNARAVLDAKWRDYVDALEAADKAAHNARRDDEGDRG